jgi:hypothetical protein
MKPFSEKTLLDDLKSRYAFFKDSNHTVATAIYTIITSSRTAKK